MRYAETRRAVSHHGHRRSPPSSPGAETSSMASAYCRIARAFLAARSSRMPVPSLHGSVPLTSRIMGVVLVGRCGVVVWVV